MLVKTKKQLICSKCGKHGILYKENGVYKVMVHSRKIHGLQEKPFTLEEFCFIKKDQ